MIATDKNISDTFKFYEEEYENTVNYKDYKYILFKYLKFLINKIIKGNFVSLPARLGILRITGVKRLKFYNEKGESLLPPDWKRTKELWNKDEEAKKNKTIIRHLNEETGGVSYRLKWIKRNVPIRNKNFLHFRLTRANKRAIAKTVKEDGQEYIITKVLK